MEPTNFNSTCTKSCHDSLTSYIHNVEEKCSGTADAALKGVGIWGKMEFKNVPVATIGRIFKNGKSCCINQSSVIPTTFDCAWSCALAYRYNQHEYPYSDWSFRDERSAEVHYGEDARSTVISNSRNVLVQHAVLNKQMEKAWNTVNRCLSSNETFKTGIDGVGVGLDTDKAVTASTSVSTGNSTGGSESESVSEGSSNGAGSASPDPENGAAHLKAVGLGTVFGFVSSIALLAYRCIRYGQWASFLVPSPHLPDRARLACVWEIMGSMYTYVQLLGHDSPTVSRGCVIWKQRPGLRSHSTQQSLPVDILHLRPPSSKYHDGHGRRSTSTALQQPHLLYARFPPSLRSLQDPKYS
ncbi:hypothetical protein BDV11DRAFT_168639 [Aspergillus similis]